MKKKEFVPHQESLELKELGFDEPCFGHFGSITEPEELQIFPNTESCLEPEDMINSNLDYGLSCTAPTFSQVFRWFRDKYGLEGFVTPLFRDKLEITFKQRKYDANVLNGTQRFHKKGFDTYEEAELACLRKLIEIVKEKQ